MTQEQPLRKPWFETPLMESAALSRRLGCRVFLKLENLQPSGSFKSRNIGGYLLHAISTHPSPSRSSIHFYTSSGGNAGLAAVIGAKSLGYPCTVVVPLSTKPMMIEKLKVAGASKVIQEGATWFHADTYLREQVLKGDENGVYVPPFDHETIWEAASGIVEESERQLAVLCSGEVAVSERGMMGEAGEREKEGQGEGAAAKRVGADVFVCSVGGGGLFSGIARGISRSSVSSSAKLIASETIGADSLASSIDAGQHVTLPGITSIATSLGAVKVCNQAYEYATNGQVDVVSVRVSDAQAVRACRTFVDEERILVEPACGAALAPLYEGILAQKVQVREGMKVVVVVCGGANISIELLEKWSEEHP